MKSEREIYGPVHLILAENEEPEVAEKAQKKLMDLIGFHARIRVELPVLMAMLLDLGKTKVVVEAVRAWGKGEKPIVKIWEELRSHLKEGDLKPEAS